MTQQEYEQKRRECWESFKFVLRAPYTSIKVFYLIFDHAYALGREKEAITLEEIEKAAREYSDSLGKSRDVTWSDAENGFIAGADFALGKQEKDAEGEVMLTCDRDVVRMLYDRTDSVKVRQTLESLFGSKCLPDNVDTSEPNVDSSHGSVESLEPKPAEPKFAKGDIVRYRYDRKLYIVECKTGKYHYALRQHDGDIMMHDALESDLEPYTEPEEEIWKSRTSPEQTPSDIFDDSDNSDPHQSRNLSQETANCDKQFDNILKDSFSKERRLNIAAQMMQGLICAPLIPGIDPNPPAENLAQMAFRLADALLAEWRKD